MLTSRLLALIVAFIGFLTVASKAMKFRLEDENGSKVIVAEGEIIAGDQARLQAVVTRAGRDKFGNIRMYLNSPGGSVASAFGIVEIMDREEFTTLVTGEAKCASACARPSFNCRGVQKPSEAAICANKRLARHDASLAKLYTDLMHNLAAEEKERIRADQRAWLKYRDSCDGLAVETCVLGRIDRRYQELLNYRASNRP
jgi:uncharacterized protein YecT (DUF1311 family)